MREVSFNSRDIFFSFECGYLVQPFLQQIKHDLGF